MPQAPLGATVPQAGTQAGAQDNAQAAPSPADATVEMPQADAGQGAQEHAGVPEPQAAPNPQATSHPGDPAAPAKD